MEDRAYQRAAVEAVEKQWDSGVQRTLIVCPTGCGKTIIFAKIAGRRVKNGEKVLVLAHREELLAQASDKIKTVTGITCGLEKAENTAAGSDVSIVVGSVQTLSNTARLNAYAPDAFSTIIIDEAHHTMAKTYLKILGYFQNAKVLGVTATPDRGDMKNLSDVFESLAFEYKLPQAIDDGYLSPIMAQTIPLKLDISKVGVNQGDFKSGDLGDALEPYLERIAEKMKEYCPKRKTAVFLPLVETSQKFRDILITKGFRAAEVNCNTPDRKEILKDFENGKYNVICNAMLLTEGWDCPSVDCIVVLRPTKIRSLYCQMIGRGTRLCPGKKDLLVLDFIWLTKRHNLCHPANLICENEQMAKKITDLIAQSEEPVLINSDIEKAAAVGVMQDREAVLAAELKEAQKHTGWGPVDLFQFTVSIQAEDILDYEPVFQWEKNPPTQKQLDALARAGLNASQITSAGKAAKLLDRIVERREAGLATPKQIRFLERKGFQKVGTWKFKSASAMIDRIAKNNWNVPAGIWPETYHPEEEPERDHHYPASTGIGNGLYTY